ncbi:MAG: hypothetical protein LUO85_05950 [Methanomassiliicoccales archaeon]|nr:hypothetical protein [Methanomassiliicoccales archaeon]
MSIPGAMDRCPSCGNYITGDRSRCDSCRKLLPRGRRLLILAVAVMVIIAAIAATLLLSGGTNDQGADLTDRAIGSGSNNFWVTYPSSHPSAGAAFSHPSWVIQALENGPVLLFAHTSGCAACLEQLPICHAVNLSFSGQITYFDLAEGQENERLLQAADVYDPTGGTHYVPMTIIVSEMKDAQNHTVVVWHSWEGVIGQKALTSWLNDAIAHFGTSP